MEKIKAAVSPWRFIDLVIPALIIFGVVLFGSFGFYRLAVICAVIAIIAVLLMKKLYIRDELRSRGFKLITAVVRAVCYAVGIIVLLLPWSMRWSVKPYYPVQKYLYGADKRLERFLPSSLPDKTDDYSAFFCKAVFPGASRVVISFYTDPETIEQYKAKAQFAGAELSGNIPHDCVTELERHGFPTENARKYSYPDGSEHFPKFYVLDESSGFVYIYY